jgi:hypothetical protein
MDGFPTPDPAAVFPEGLEPNQEDNEKRSLNKLVGLSQLILTALQGGLSVSWGNITGTLSNQTDLQTELDSKVERSAPVLVTSGDQNETYNFANNTNDQSIYDNGVELSLGVITVNLPSDATSRLGQECTFWRKQGVQAGSSITFAQTGGGFVSFETIGPSFEVTVTGNFASITWRKVAANTWATTDSVGTWTSV